MPDKLNLPKVSFVVISHNFEKYILGCLESIKKQSYDNFEIIVVDDCSSDSTGLIIEDFARSNRHLDIIFVKNHENMGQLASFLEGVKIARGEFVSQIDGDDVLLEDYALSHIETHLKTCVALTSCQNLDIDENNTVHSFSSIDCPRDSQQEFSLNAKNAGEIGCLIAPVKTEEELEVKILSNDKYNYATWHWAPASSGMIRKSVCDLLLMIKRPKDIKITADKFVFSFAHLVGSSAIIYKPLYAYRKHQTNYSLANPVFGSVRYLRTKTQKNYIRNNKLIRQAMLGFVLSNYNAFVETFNKANVRRMIKKIIFSFDISTLKSAIKSLFI